MCTSMLEKSVRVEMKLKGMRRGCNKHARQVVKACLHEVDMRLKGERQLCKDVQKIQARS